jgi:uncharacterized protein YdhG (YjbR/CyaY superfamily)
MKKRGRTSKSGPPATIDEYMAGFPREVQILLKQMREAIKSVVPEAEEAVKYGIPTFILGENLVHFAAFKNHIGFYPTPSGIEAFKDELSIYKGAKGSVQFPLEQPMPVALVKKIVRFRKKEALARSAARTKRRKR